MAKRRVKSVSRASAKMSQVMQFAVVFIIVAAIALAYYVGTMR